MRESVDWFSKLGRHRFCRVGPSHRHHALRHVHADHCRLLPLRASAILQGAVYRRLSADHDLSPCLRFSFRLSYRNKFIGHGIVIGVFVLVPILFNFGWENTPLPVRQYSALHLQRHERIRALRARSVLVYYLLAGDLSSPRRHLHRLCSPWGGRCVARSPPSGRCSPAAPDPSPGYLRLSSPWEVESGTTTTRMS